MFVTGTNSKLECNSMVSAAAHCFLTPPMVLATECHAQLLRPRWHARKRRASRPRHTLPASAPHAARLSGTSLPLPSDPFHQKADSESFSLFCLPFSSTLSVSPLTSPAPRHIRSRSTPCPPLLFVQQQHRRRKAASLPCRSFLLFFPSFTSGNMFLAQSHC